MVQKLDKFDLKIFSEIEFDYNKSHSSIAKVIGRSKSFVSYRIKKMQKDNIISYLPLIDYSSLGYKYFRIIIETTLSKYNLIDKLKSLDLKTVWLIEKYDQENFVFVILAKTLEEFQQIWENMYSKISEDIISKNISFAFKVHHLDMNFFHKSQNNRKCFISGANKKQKLNVKDVEIINLIQSEPRITNYSLAKKLNIDILTLKKYVNNLKQNKIILGYQTIINKNILNLQHYKIFVNFDFNLDNKNKLILILKSYENCVYITESSLGYDLEFELFVENNLKMQQVIDSIKKEFKLKRIVVTQMKSEEKLV